MPLDPNKPTVLTFYVPFTSGLSHSGMSLRDQTVAARTKLFATSFRDYEQQIREHLGMLFGDYGFVADRDIAGITLNRWGHALVVGQPGFFFGLGGHGPASDVIRAGYGRVRFGHSELSGRQGWAIACDEGQRAAEQAMRLMA
jgi:spermidine dehydrogenase